MKKSAVYILGILLLSTTAFAQTKKYPLSNDLSEKMLATIPVKDNHILFEGEIKGNPSMTKDELFAKLQKWFADSFAGDKSEIQVNDKEKGVFSGKAAYKYTKSSGLVVNRGYVNCVLQIAVANGSIKYQMSDFQTNEGTNGLTGLSAGIKHSYELNQVLEDYKNDKKSNLARRQLDNMNQVAYYVQMSLQEMVN